ncbi:MAG: hypothetical protein NTV21_20145, partial [Planctomycetota bacterium]|nr:hypothetical protein [Planctomycetota bacterium]
MFRKLVLVLLALPILYFGARWIVRAFESDEERIRRAVAEMVEGFNEAQGRPVLAALSKNFVDTSSGATREDVRSALIAWFFEQVDPVTKKFLFVAELEQLDVQVDEAAREAQVSVTIRFEKRRGDTLEPWWNAAIEGVMRDGEDGWQWVKSTK